MVERGGWGRRPPWMARAAQVESSLHMDVHFLACPSSPPPPLARGVTPNSVFYPICEHGLADVQAEVSNNAISPTLLFSSNGPSGTCRGLTSHW